MSNKVLKIAGKDLESLTRGILVNNRGELIPDDGGVIVFNREYEVLAGGKQFFNFESSSPFRVFVFIASGNVETPWRLTLGGQSLLGASGTTGLYETQVLLESSGQPEPIKGRGNRSRAFTGVLFTPGTKFNPNIENLGQEPLTFNIVVVKYPHSAALVELLNSTVEVADIILETVSDEEGPYPKTLYETDTYTRIEYLEFASTSPDWPIIQILPKNKSGSVGTPLGTARHVTGGGTHMSMANLDVSMSSLFDKLHRDADGAKYALNRYLTFPHGVVIRITSSDSPVNFALRGYAVRRESV